MLVVFFVNFPRFYEIFASFRENSRVVDLCLPYSFWHLRHLASCMSCIIWHPVSLLLYSGFLFCFWPYPNDSGCLAAEDISAAVIPDVNGVPAVVGTPACCRKLHYFCKRPCFSRRSYCVGASVAMLSFSLLHAADVTVSACVTPVACASVVADIAAVARVPLVHDVLTVAGHPGIAGVTGVVGVRSFLLLLSFQIFRKKNKWYLILCLVHK